MGENHKQPLQLSFLFPLHRRTNQTSKQANRQANTPCVLLGLILPPLTSTLSPSFFLSLLKIIVCNSIPYFFVFSLGSSFLILHFPLIFLTIHSQFFSLGQEFSSLSSSSSSPLSPPFLIRYSYL
ncbi:hypothetical protein L873DRAFT_1105209 [Choiromyces venosus 120613-1]|uniref:Uncharacterized protein n=1 Tax=Choiromyces venosus 120613-1 TaxID=1336337 RepID=A0A3N4JHG3_9PEZI|nr:hypothetical protein L873DRAFT_1105209 [Choiromyces venosus 120613-1]